MRTLITTVFVLSISGCASTPPPTSGVPVSSISRSETLQQTARHPGQRIARLAVSMVGMPYQYGGSAPETGFDCSGLVFYSYNQSGISVPRSSLDQFRSATKISLNDAREGDLLFFQDQEKLSHVGIFLGNNRFVHAPDSGRTVSIANLDNPWYQMHLVGVGRLLQ